MSEREEMAACINTDREIWRGPDEGCGDAYADSLHITKEGGLGINCGGRVYVMPVREWHRLAALRSAATPAPGYTQGFEACREAAKQCVVDLTKKWGDPVGLDYEQGAQDHGNRMLAAIAALPAPAGVEVTPGELWDWLVNHAFKNTKPVHELLCSTFTILAKPAQEGHGS